MAAQAAKRWKNVWVIGASSGIGEALAHQLSPLCETVTISARSTEKLEKIHKTHANMHGLPLDITDGKRISAAVQELESRHGPIDLVIISSGVWRPAKLPELNLDAFRESMETNFLGVVGVISELAPRMAHVGQGQIAIISSVAGYRGLPNAAAYAPTKAALINLAECIYPQLKRMGVHLSLVNPGFVETPMTSVNKFPMPFIQTPERAAEKILHGLKKKAYEIAFPRRLVFLLKFMRFLPNAVFFWLVNRFVLR